MTRRTFVIAIDGPAASGKSSTAQMLAEKLGYLHVDSGSLYRAATAAILREERDPSKWTEQGILDAARPIELRAARTSFTPVIEGRASGGAGPRGPRNDVVTHVRTFNATNS